MTPADQTQVVWHALSPDETCARLQTRRDGLSEAEAGERLAQHGANTLPEAPALGVARTVLKQFASPLIYLLLAAGLLSLVIGDRWDAIFIFGVLATNACVGAFQEWRADSSAKALRSLVPQDARIRRGGHTRDVPAVEVVPGDIVELESGMQVVADMRLLEAQGLQVEEAALTGESLPVAKRAETSLAARLPLGDRTNMVFAGTSLSAGRALGAVVDTGQHTQLGHIGRTLDEARGSDLKTPLVRRMDQLARHIAVASVGLIAVLAAVLLLQGGDWRDIALLSIALAVAAIPEGLPIAVTVALAAASRRMARRNVIVRALPAVEGLGSCTLIASDKTGTLTINRLSVEAVTGTDGATFHRKKWDEVEARDAIDRLATAAALCNEARLTETGSPVGDSVDVALLEFAVEHGVDIAELMQAHRYAVIPYEPELRFAAVEAELGEQSQIVVKGAPETVLSMCAPSPALEAAAEALAAEGYRVIMLAQGTSDGSGSGNLHSRLRGLEPLGFVGLADPLRFGAVEAVRQCREAGIEVRMITGDHPATALSIARQLGLQAQEANVLTGSEMADLAHDNETLQRRIADATVFARIEPRQKLEIVRCLAHQGHIVAVTGDGVNDGPALRAADIGVAMGRHGTDVARGAANLILADDNFATIVAGVEEGRITFSNIRKIVVFMLATGVAEIGIFLTALACGLPMPLTPVQLLWLNLVTNGVQDVTLGFGRGEGDELRRPPRRKLAALIDRRSLVLMVPGALVMTLIAVWFLDRQLAAGSSLTEARNGVLLMVVLYQNAFLLGLRHLHKPFWHWSERENRFLFGGLVLALTLQVGAMLTPLGQAMLGVGPVDLETILICLGAGVVVLMVNEFAKRLAPATAVSGQLRREAANAHA